MIVQIKRIILLLGIVCLPIETIFSQHSSKNNYTGAWETPTSWIPTWPVPQTNISGYNITINGYITVNGSLSFFGAPTNPVSYTHLRAHETVLDLVCRLLLE